MAEEPELVAAGVRGPSRTEKRSGPFGMPAARPVQNPFGAPAVSPWNAPLPNPFPAAPARQPQSAMETVQAAAEQTPDGKPAAAPNPFSRGDLSDAAPKKTNWGMILAAAGGAVVAGGALAMMKFLG